MLTSECSGGEVSWGIIAGDSLQFSPPLVEGEGGCKWGGGVVPRGDTAWGMGAPGKTLPRQGSCGKFTATASPHGGGCASSRGDGHVPGCYRAQGKGPPIGLGGGGGGQGAWGCKSCGRDLMHVDTTRQGPCSCRHPHPHPHPREVLEGGGGSEGGRRGGGLAGTPLLRGCPSTFSTFMMAVKKWKTDPNSVHSMTR